MDPLTYALSKKHVVGLRGAANGLAELDASARLPIERLPPGITGLTYKGTWDANSPEPAPANTGEYWIVSAPGTTNLDGITTWSIGDWAIYNGSTWGRIPARPTQGYLDVTAFGATGDGVTDDLTAVQNAINAAAASGINRVYMPAGTYAISNHILVPEGMELSGAGKWIVTIRPHPDFPLDTQSLIRSADPYGTDYITISGLGVDRENYGTHPYSKGIWLSRTRHSRIHDCRVVNCKSYGIYVDSTTNIDGQNPPIRISRDVIVSDCYAENNEEQIEIRSCDNVTVRGNTVVNTPGRSINAILFYLHNSNGIICENHVTGEGGNGINLTQTATGCLVENNKVELLDPHVACVLANTPGHQFVGGSYTRLGTGGGGGGYTVRFDSGAVDCSMDGVHVSAADRGGIYVSSSAERVTVRGGRVALTAVPASTAANAINIDGATHCSVIGVSVPITGEPTLSQVSAIRATGKGQVLNANQVAKGRIWVSGTGHSVLGNNLQDARLEFGGSSASCVAIGNVLHASALVDNGTGNEAANNLIISL